MCVREREYVRDGSGAASSTARDGLDGAVEGSQSARGCDQKSLAQEAVGSCESWNGVEWENEGVRTREGERPGGAGNCGRARRGAGMRNLKAYVPVLQQHAPLPVPWWQPAGHAVGRCALFVKASGEK